jgi:hypothetical protein
MDFAAGVYQISQSYWYFRPSFVNCRRSNLLSGLAILPTPPSPLPCVNKYTKYTRIGTVCKGGYGVIGGEGASDR